MTHILVQVLLCSADSYSLAQALKSLTAKMAKMRLRTDDQIEEEEEDEDEEEEKDPEEIGGNFSSSTIYLSACPPLFRSSPLRCPN